MAISVVQRNIVGNAAVSASPTLAYGSNVTAGNALIAATLVGSVTGVIGYPIDSLSNTYNPTQLIPLTQGCIMMVHIAYNTPGGANTVTFSTGLKDSAVMIFEVSGLASYNAFDTFAFNGQSSATSLTSGNTATTAFANELLLGFSINTNSTSLLPTVGAGYSNLQTIGVTFASSGSEEQIISSTGAQAATFGLAANSAQELTAIYTFSDTPNPSRRILNPASGLGANLHDSPNIRPHSFSPGLSR